MNLINNFNSNNNNRSIIARKFNINSYWKHRFNFAIYNFYPGNSISW